MHSSNVIDRIELEQTCQTLFERATSWTLTKESGQILYTFLLHNATDSSFTREVRCYCVQGVKWWDTVRGNQKES